VLIYPYNNNNNNNLSHILSISNRGGGVLAVKSRVYEVLHFRALPQDAILYT